MHDDWEVVQANMDPVTGLELDNRIAESGILLEAPDEDGDWDEARLSA